MTTERDEAGRKGRKLAVETAQCWYDEAKRAEKTGDKHASMYMENAFNHTENALFAARRELTTLAAERDRLREAMIQIDEMPASMVNDSESLRHTIRTIQSISSAALHPGKQENEK